MRYGRVLYCCVIFLISFTAFSQKNYKIIVDEKTKLPIDFVYINSDNRNVYLLSNKDGKFILPVETNIHSLTFYKIGYRKKIISLSDLLKTDTIFLSENAIELADVSITARIIDTLVKDKRFYVNDYLVLPNNDILLLTSKLNVRGFEILYFKKNRGITQTKKIRNEAGESLTTDCFKNIHVLTADHSRQVFFESDSTFDFLPKYTRAEFDSILAPCVLKIDTQVIVKSSPPPILIQDQMMQNSFYLNYVSISKSRRKLFYTVMYNKKLMEMLINEMSDDKVMVGMTPVAKEGAHKLFYSKIAAPVYAPIFLKNDTVLVFNFQAGTIVSFDKAGRQLTEIRLNSQSFSSFRDFEVIYDEGQQHFYLKTKKAEKACLQKINCYTGELSPEIKLEKIFAKNIQVHNGRIYYLVKEKEWDDTCYLYQQNW